LTELNTGPAAVCTVAINGFATLCDIGEGWRGGQKENQSRNSHTEAIAQNGLLTKSYG
jgi:hypothetical protein